MSKITTGRVPSKETRKKISDSNIGKPKSDETKESIVMGLIKYFETHDAWNKGLKNTFKHTDEAKKKMSKPGELNPFYDKHHTEESLEKMRKSHKGRIWINKDGERKRLKEEEAKSYLENGWQRGKNSK